MMNLIKTATLILTPFIPLYFAAMGGVLSEKAGIINLALESFLLISAFICGIVFHFTRSPLLAVLTACSASALWGFLHFLFTTELRINHIISGLGLNIFTSGLTVYLTSVLFNEERSFHIPYSGHPVYLFFVLFIMTLVLVSVFLHGTGIGLRYRSVGENPLEARVAGVRTGRYKAWGLVASGFLTGLGGAFLVLQSGSFVKDISAGRGYIALAAVIFGNWKPLSVTMGVIIFASFEWLGIFFQGSLIPNQIISMLPYLVTLLFLMGIFKKASPPASLGKIYG